MSQDYLGRIVEPDRQVLLDFRNIQLKESETVETFEVFKHSSFKTYKKLEESIR